MDDLPAVTVEANGHDGVFMDFDNIVIAAEERVLVAHEGGHAMTGATHALNSPYEVVAQHESRADKWASPIWYRRTNWTWPLRPATQKYGISQSCST